ncbi:MAG: DegQ family serine endoprotease [Alphaproteobacteria bacterium]|nr:DegQ family serine endoprotease [Alphaproteobacteria bacterium]
MDQATLRRIPAAAIAVVLAFGFPGPSRAQPDTIPVSRFQYPSFAPLVKQAAPAVVNIYTKRVVRSAKKLPPLMNDPFFRHFFGEQLGLGVPEERVQSSLGSGVIFRPDGVVVTNDHVVKDSEQITVVLADRREFDAKVLGTDERTDLAVLKIETHGERLPSLPLGDSDEIEVGDPVLAIGNPFGVGQTVTSGIVSALARTTVGISDYRFFIQTDASINPGNSGGALITTSGRLAGINTAIYSRDGGSVGIGFAIPANMVRTVVDGILSEGRAVHPWIGAAGQAVTQEIANSLGLSRPSGVLLSQVHKGGPAAAAGLRVGDVVMTINGHPVDDSEALRYRVAILPVGDNALLEVVQGGDVHKISVKLTAPPDTPPREVTEVSGRNPFDGVTVANINPALAEELGLDVFDAGVIITKLRRDSIAERLGVHPGDHVLSINDERIALVADLKKALLEPAQSWQISLKRGKTMLSLSVGG